MNKTQLLFLVILIEGYVVLASELIAIRSLIPFVGSGTETISIIISAVLLPLAVGYHVGGNAFKTAYAKSKKDNKKHLSIRKLLLKNIITSLIILTLGLSYMFQEIFFSILEAAGIKSRIIETTIYSVLFLSYPVYLLGQTVPLISNYFSRAKLSEITGKMLFFSTTGSFLGSVFSTIVLMTYVGVHNTVIFTLSLLCVLVFLLIRTFLSFEAMLCGCIFIVLVALNNNSMMKQMKVVSNNSYNLISVFEDKKKEEKILSINRSGSSQVSTKEGEHKHGFPYIAFVEENFINPSLKNPKQPLDFLIIGAGGFTIGLNDTYNNYTFVDIDPDLQKVSEEHFLPEKLTPNKKFIASSARAFVHNNKNKYDLIFIDVFTNKFSIPMECTTREFLLDVKKLLKDNGAITANIISSPTFSDKFTVRYHNTFRSVFPVFTRQIVNVDELWNPHKNEKEKLKNIMYTYFNNEYVEDNGVYTDDKNSYSLDRP